MTILTLFAPCISESCVKIKIDLNFYFTLLRDPSKGCVKKGSVKKRSRVNFLSLSGIGKGRVKGELKTNFNSCFQGIFSEFYRWRTLYKILWRFDQFSQSYEIKKFWIQNIFCIFLLILHRKNLLQTFMAFSTIFHVLKKKQRSF